MTIAVAGASGFIGSATVRALLTRNQSVRALVRKTSDLGRLTCLRESEIHRVEFTSVGSLTTALKGSAAVIYAGGPGLAECVRLRLTEGEGVNSLLQAAKLAGCRRFVYLSTVKARAPLGEGVSPTDLYGRRKRAEESLVVGARGLQWAIVRAGAVYGPGDRKLLTIFQLASRSWIPLLGTKARGKFSLVHVCDLARLLAALALEDIARSTIFEMGSERALTWNELVLLLAAPNAHQIVIPPSLLRIVGIAGTFLALTGCKQNLVRERIADLVQYDWSVLPTLNCRNALTTDLEDGLIQTRDWYFQNRWLE